MSPKSSQGSNIIFLVLGAIGFITGIFGNLIAAWIQQEWSEIFTLNGFIIVVTLTILGLLFAAWLESRQGRASTVPFFLRVRHFIDKIVARLTGKPLPAPPTPTLPSLDDQPLIIDRTEAMEAFRNMLAQQSDKRHLRLVGEENMGKTRLVDEFGVLAAKDFNANVAKVDCQQKTITQISIFWTIIDQIGSRYFPGFNEAYKDYSKAPLIQVPQDISLLSINLEKDRLAEEHRIRQLLTAFTLDLEAMGAEKLVVLLFDTFDEAPDFIKGWLNEQFLLSLYRLKHIYVVFSGRSLPDAVTPCKDACIYCILDRVGLEDVVKWCLNQRYDIDEQVLDIIHKSTLGAPGAIVPLLRNYLKGE